MAIPYTNCQWSLAEVQYIENVVYKSMANWRWVKRFKREKEVMGASRYVVKPLSRGEKTHWGLFKSQDIPHQNWTKNVEYNPWYSETQIQWSGIKQSIKNTGSDIVSWLNLVPAVHWKGKQIKLTPVESLFSTGDYHLRKKIREQSSNPNQKIHRHDFSFGVDFAVKAPFYMWFFSSLQNKAHEEADEKHLERQSHYVWPVQKFVNYLNKENPDFNLNNQGSFMLSYYEEMQKSIDLFALSEQMAPDTSLHDLLTDSTKFQDLVDLLKKHLKTDKISPELFQSEECFQLLLKIASQEITQEGKSESEVEKTALIANWLVLLFSNDTMYELRELFFKSLDQNENPDLKDSTFVVKKDSPFAHSPEKNSLDYAQAENLQKVFQSMHSRVIALHQMLQLESYLRMEQDSEHVPAEVLSKARQELSPYLTHPLVSGFFEKNPQLTVEQKTYFLTGFAHQAWENGVYNNLGLSTEIGAKNGLETRFNQLMQESLDLKLKTH